MEAEIVDKRYIIMSSNLKMDGDYVQYTTEAVVSRCFIKCEFFFLFL